MLSHLNLAIFRNGYIGVDVFFVISGFIITKILIDEININKTLNLKNFYLRRFRRLIPNLSLMIFVTVSLSYFLMNPINDQQTISKSAISSLFGLSNLYYILVGSKYFNSLSSNPLIHTWSLSIELQFYLIYPFILSLFFSRYNKKYFKNTLLILGVFSLAYTFVVANFLSPSIQDLNFYDPISRIWEFLLGAAVVIIKKLTNGKSRIKYLTGLIMISISLVQFLPNNFPSNQLITRILATLGAVLVVSSGESANKSKVLTNKAIVYFGDRSYSIYLWHFPIIIFSNKIIDNEIFSSAISLVLIAIFSVASYKYIELPFHRGEYSKISSKRMLAIFIITPAIIALAVGANAKYYLFPKFNKSGQYLYHGQVGDTNVQHTVNKNLFTCVFDSTKLDCPNFDKSSGHILVIGDSHAGSLVGPISKISVVPVLYIPTKSFTDDRYKRDIPEFGDYLSANKPTELIIIANWDRLGVSQNLKDLLLFLNSVSIPNKILEDNPYFNFDAFTCAYGRSIFIRNNLCSQKILTNPRLADVVKEFPNSKYIAIKKYFCNHTVCSMVSKNKILYFDSNHLNSQGAIYLVERLVTNGLILSQESFDKETT